ncbi:MAG: DUF2272 domain-containing protein [Beijerinckiaceae bacterium]
MRTAFLALAICCVVFTQAIAQPFPDARERVEIKYDEAAQPVPRSVRVKNSQCRESISDAHAVATMRQQIVDLAAREWEAFHFPVLDIASEGLPLIPKIQTQQSRQHGHALVPDALNPVLPQTYANRALRNGLVEDDATIAARIGGYWAVVPNTSAIATQNHIWAKGGWPGAGWAQPWSAAFISWVMCEAGFTRAQFMRAPSHANYIAGFFQNKQASAFTPQPLTTMPQLGDLACASRNTNAPLHSPEDARQVALDDAPMHCDIIVGFAADRIFLIGGNVNNAVTLTVAPRNRDGTIKATQQRPWFGLMQLNAPPDPKGGLARTPWRCLGQPAPIRACLAEH